MEVKNPLADFGRRQDHRPPPLRPGAETATQVRKIKQLDGNLPNTGEGHVDQRPDLESRSTVHGSRLHGSPCRTLSPRRSAKEARFRARHLPVFYRWPAANGKSRNIRF